MPDAPFVPAASSWPVCTLGELCELGGGDIQTGPFGSQLHASDYVAAGVPSIMPKNIADNRVSTEDIAYITEEDAQRLSRYRVKPGDIVYSRRGDVEKRALIRSSEDGWLCGTGCLRVRPGEGGLDSVYLSYYLAHPAVRSWIVQHAIGATMPNLNTSILSELPVVAPPAQTQRRIAHILGTLDNKIELNRRMNRTLEGIARAIFKSWFVDFDPVHAKAEGREPVGMDPETAALFPDSFQDSPLGQIPKGWEVKPFSEIVEINPSRPIKKGQVAAYVDMAALPTSGSQLRVQPAAREYKSGSRFRNGDVLIARITPCLENGKTALVDFLRGDEIGAGSTEFLVFGPRMVGTFFAYCASRSTALREHAIVSMTGTSGRQRVQKGAFVHLEMAVPSTATLARFESCIAALFTAQHESARQNISLSAVRDALLPQLLSGSAQSMGSMKGGRKGDRWQ